MTTDVMIFQGCFILLGFIYVWASSRERRLLVETIAKERAVAVKVQAELLDRLLEKEVLSRFAQGIPVPDAVLERSQANGAADQENVEYSGPMTPEIEAYINELRAMGKPDKWIAQQLARAQK